MTKKYSAKKLCANTTTLGNCAKIDGNSINRRHFGQRWMLEFVFFLLQSSAKQRAVS